MNPIDDRPGRLRLKAVRLGALLLAANVAAWAWAWAAFAGAPALLGAATLAYAFGLRHAFDADHLAAIDNVVRKLMHDGRRPLAAGFFFSLGHSTVVILASVAIATATTAMQSRLDLLHDLGGGVGTAISAAFLLAVGLANLLVLLRLMGREAASAADGAPLAVRGGFLARILAPVLRFVGRSWHMYPVGFLFGLGFDTATEIGLLGIAATAAAQTVSLWSILVFPALFTAGMSLVDTADSIAMTGAYGWAFADPRRKRRYNLVVTALSVAVAFVVGSSEALSLVGGFGPDGALANLGVALVLAFGACWLVAAAADRRAAGTE